MQPTELRRRILNHQGLAPLPPLLRDALRLAENDRVGLAALVHHADEAPELAAYMCAAARECCAGYPVYAPADAISLLGAAGVRKVLLQAVVPQRFPVGALGSFPLADFWAGALRRGMEAERIAKFLDSPWAEHAYAAAYVQDIGRPVLALLAPDAYEKVQGAVFSRGLQLLEAELSELGVDHALAGKWLAEVWQLPPAYVEAIWLHHHAPCILEGLAHALPLLDILALAEHLANRGEAGGLAGAPAPRPITERLERLGIDPAQLEAWAAEPLQPGAPREVPSPQMSPVCMQPAEVRPRPAEARYQALCALLAGDSFGNGRDTRLAAIATALRAAFAAPAGFCCTVSEDTSVLDAVLWLPDVEEIESFQVPVAEGGKGAAFGQILSRFDRRRSSSSPPLDLVTLPLGGAGQTQGQMALLLPGGAPDREVLLELHRFAAACGAWLAQQTAHARSITRSESLATAIWKQEAGFRRRLQSDRLAGISQLAAGAAHEINNPLAVISGRAQILLSRTQGEEDAKALDTIIRQSRRITQILTDLMQFARPTQPRFESMLLHYVIHQVLASLRERFEGKGIRIVEEYAQTTARVRVDPHQMQRVFLNIFLNAEEAMARGQRSGTRQGGTLHVSVRTRNEGSAVEIRVEDSGPGIPASIVDQVFEPFFTTKNVGEGTGLGLAVCHGIVEAHGGHISIESRAGSGAAVVLQLPTVHAYQTRNVPLSVVENIDAPPIPPPGKTRLLLAEPDEVLADILRETMRQRGFEIRAVRDGLEAFAVLAAGGADLLLMEHSLTGIAGEALFDEIRTRFPELPVIVLTGPTEEVDAGAILRRGAQACLCKPFEMAGLLAEIQAATSVRNVA